MRFNGVRKIQVSAVSFFTRYRTVLSNYFLVFDSMRFYEIYIRDVYSLQNVTIKKVPEEFIETERNSKHGNQYTNPEFNY